MLEQLLSRIKKEDDRTEKEKHGYNPYLLSKIQPQGGIKFNEAHTRKGDGFETCIHVYDFQSIVTEFWLEQIMNIPNVVASLDVSTPNRKNIIDNINKSMAEQKVRGENAKETADVIEAAQSYDELQDIYNEIRQGEVMKRIILRLFISAKTIDELETKAKEVLDTLESLNFRGSVMLNEQEFEWSGLFTHYTEQQKYPNKRKGTSIPSLSLAAGFPFHFTSLSDPDGLYYGTTDTNGNVIFDLFHKDNKRKHYNALMIGKMGSGKSTLLKKVALDYGTRGNKIRVLDITGEFEALTREHEGKIIALDGSQGKINPLQVYKTGTDEDGTSNEQLSFTQHLSKMNVFYRFLSPDASSNEVKLYGVLLNSLYQEMGLWGNNKEKDITDLKTTEYPTFSDFLQYVRRSLYQDIPKRVVHDNLTKSDIEHLRNIELNIENLVLNYSHLFDGHSSIEQFNEEDFVSFPLRNLSELSPEIFQAQLFNVMNMLWDGMLNNGQPQFKAYNKNQINFKDTVKYLLLIDEAHHIINTKKGSEHAVNYLQRFMREARKYFGGIFFASHLITDFVPENADQSSAEEVKKLFGLTQYKFIAEQDSESLGKLKEVFTGQLNNSELAQIPYLQTGQVMLSISSVGNTKMSVDCSQEELALFGGGA